MRTLCRFLSDAEKERIHGDSLKILAEVGVRRHEIACLCKRLRDGIQVSDARDHLEDVARARPGGNYLMEEGTLAVCRNEEFYRPRLIDPGTLEQWEKLGRPDLTSRARERVREILASPRNNPLPDEAAGRLEDIIRRADQRLREA